MRSRRALWLAAAFAVILLVVIAAVVVLRLTSRDPATVTVMTRNVYLGADVNRPVEAARGLTGAEALAALGRANHELRAVVDETDFRVRSRLLAAEIAAARPDLVGLQEVALWRSGPLELDRVGVPNATAVDQDFLDLLLAELTRQGLRYDVAVVQEEADVEAPALPDPGAARGRTGRDVRLTLRDVILVRADAGLTVRGRGGGQYAARLTVDLAGVTFGYARGFAWVDVATGGTGFRFVTTHLESGSTDVNRAQAGELLAGPAAERAQPVVLAGDCNSPADPPGAGYAVLTGPDGFADAWTAQPDAGPGLTFGVSEAVVDPAPVFDRRIDLVLARGLTSDQLAASRGEVTGDQPADRDPATGLWPSDHAGVVLTLRIA